ncbi:hypothetical protein [Halosimplex sp. J119]
MQRRTLLGLAASAGVLGVFGATVGDPGQPAAPPAKRAEEPILPTGQRDTPVVATDTTTVGTETYGTVLQDASVLDLKPTERYALVTRYRLIPGSNYQAGNGWKITSLTVEHDWRSGSLVSHSGDVVPVDDDDGDSYLYLGTDQSTRRYQWNLTFGTATGDSSTIRFASVIDLEATPETADTLVDAMFGAGFTKGFLRASEQDRATARVALQGKTE